jgi:hypothetical protein
VEIWKAEEYCDLEDGAYLHILVYLERKKSQMFQGFGEFHGRYFSFIFSYVVSLDGGVFVPTDY